MSIRNELLNEGQAKWYLIWNKIVYKFEFQTESRWKF